MAYPLPMYYQQEDSVTRDLEYLQQMYPSQADLPPSAGLTGRAHLLSLERKKYYIQSLSESQALFFVFSANSSPSPICQERHPGFSGDPAEADR